MCVNPFDWRILQIIIEVFIQFIQLRGVTNAFVVIKFVFIFSFFWKHRAWFLQISLLLSSFSKQNVIERFFWFECLTIERIFGVKFNILFVYISFLAYFSTSYCTVISCKMDKYFTRFSYFTVIRMYLDKDIFAHDN